MWYCGDGRPVARAGEEAEPQGGGPEIRAGRCLGVTRLQVPVLTLPLFDVLQLHKLNDPVTPVSHMSWHRMLFRQPSAPIIDAGPST